ncbi:MAG: amidohydrolase [Xanthomonadales bacterium]|nr:amidohydrolase [Xanthomonadales bacterium]
MFQRRLPNRQIRRRRFAVPLLSAGLTLAVAACSPDSGPAPAEGGATTVPASAAGPRAPSGSVTVIHGALVHTMNPEAPEASALAFSETGALLAVGDSAALLATYPDAEAIDMAGKTIIPGLIDSHGHLHGLAESLTRAQLSGTRSLEEVIARLKAHEEKLGEDDWLLGRGWDQNDWPRQAFPSKEDLDRHFPDRPVWLRRVDGHAAWGNSAALARVDRDLSGDWQVNGGMIHRDEAGRPTGIFIDGAMGLVEAITPETSDAVMMDAIDLAIAQLLSLGLTGVHDPGIGRTALDRFQRKLEQGKLHTRLYAMTDGAGETLDWLCEHGPLAEDGRLFMRATKLYGDGALGSRGAALIEDYSDDPGNRGLLFLEKDAMQARIEKVLACGFQAGVHAIGDRANRVVIDALEAAMAAHPDNPGRHRVEHAQIVHADDLRRFAELDIIAAMQPTHATSDMYWAEDRVGPQRILGGYAWRTLLDSGALLAFGSDFPVEEVDPRLGLFAAVARQDLDGWPEGGWYPDERVTREAALRGFTLDAAYAGFMEDLVGSLEPGKRADFVVLDRDYMTIPVTEIPKMAILETWLDGERVYPR